MTPRKTSLRSFLRDLRLGQKPDCERALNSLVGLPEGGWADTQRAYRAIADELPRASSFTAGQLVEQVMCLDHADRYQWKESWQ
jgi:hypothetical protein